MSTLPVRGPGVRALGLPLPPARMPLVSDGRPLKRWRYVGVFGPDLMVCVGEARVGGLPQRWWAVALPDGTLWKRTTSGRGGVSLEPGSVRVAARDVAIELTLDEAPWPRDLTHAHVHDDGSVEVASHHGDSYIWTRKQGGVPVRGTVRVNGTEHAIDGRAFIDDSAGYHARHTTWWWSAGLGRGAGGEAVAWNLVDGVHDARADSERTVWVDGEPQEIAPVAFADDLSRVGDLEFTKWSERTEDTNRLLVRSRYRQPFGTFSGTLPNGLELAEGYGAMEWHDAYW